MPDSFDPYYHWFGIRPDDQPPHHYRLLGIEPLEDALVVIDEAYHRRANYLDEFLGGPHHKDATRLLAELAAARDCLLNPPSKAVYDDRFLPAQPVAPEPTPDRAPRRPPRPPPLAAPPVENDVAPDIAAQPARVADQPATRRTSRWKWPAVLGASALIVAALIVALANGIFRTDEEVPADAGIVQSNSARPDAPLDISSRGQQVLSAKDETESHIVADTEDPTTSESDGAASTFDDVQLDSPNSHGEQDAAPSGTETAADEPISSTLVPRDGLTLWLDASDDDSLLVSEAGRVDQWRDLSGGGNHASPTDAAPIALAETSSGLRVVRFQGQQSFAVANEDAFDLGDNYSFIFVALGAEGVLADKGDGYRAGAFSFWNGVETFRTHNRMIRSGDDSPLELKVRSLICNDDSIRWFIDGRLTSENDHEHTINNDAPLLIGCRGKSVDPRHFSGELAELLVYSRALDDRQRGQVERALRTKWLTALSPSGDLAAREIRDADPDHIAPGKRDALPDVSKITGQITREVWSDCKGNTLEDALATIEQRPAPSASSQIDTFEAPENVADNYAQRISGYLHPPETGEYSFAIRANAVGALWISTDAAAENKRRIENSQAVRLTAGEVYYIEGLHKESTGLDHFSVGWTLPSGAAETPIPGSRLSVQPRFIPPHEEKFVVLKPVRATSSRAAALAIQDNGSILADGAGPASDVYEITLQPDMPALSGICIEALPHDSLPLQGPGLDEQGRFSLAEMTAEIAPAGGDVASRRQVKFSRALETGRGVQRLIDDDPKTKWPGGPGENRFAVLILKKREKLESTDQIVVRIVNHESVGCFRILATSAANPQSAFRSEESADPPDDDGFLLLVNVGGGQHTDERGAVWRASRDFDGTQFGGEAGTAVTTDDAESPLAGSAQRGILAFRAVVPNGTYEVGLYFCEYWTDDAARRVFSVAVEQKPVLRGFDLLSAAGGSGRPFIFPVRRVVVKDGRLDIDFKPDRPDASAILNAVSIRRIR